MTKRRIGAIATGALALGILSSGAADIDGRDVPQLAASPDGSK